MATDKIWVIAYSNEGMCQGMVYYWSLLNGNDILDPDIYANKVANAMDVELAKESGYIPNSCGDMRVEFWFEKPKFNINSDNSKSVARYPVHIWSGKSYYFR